MNKLLSVNPFRCRMWDGHARLADQIDEEGCRDEIDSFLTHGQQIPVLGRPCQGDNDHDFELIYGARRLFVARRLNISLLLECRELSEREATVALDIENRQRKEFSPYERGRSYAAWLRAGIFSSQQELARALNISASQVSRLIRLAQLPSVVVGAFATPLEICERWGGALMDMWQDPTRQHALTATARALSKQPPLPGHAVFRRLIATPAQTHRNAQSADLVAHDEVVKDEDGLPLFRVRQHRRDTALLLPTTSVPEHVLTVIKNELAAILHRARTEATDSPRQIPRRPLRSRPETNASTP